MVAVRLPDTIRRRLEKEGRLPTVLVPARTVRTGPDSVHVEPATMVTIKTLRGGEDWPLALSVQAQMSGLPAPVREHRFHPVRKWRFDLAYPDRLVAVEVDGGSFVGGRHTSGAGFRGDCEKLSEAAALGWRVLRVMPEHVESGQALGWLERALRV